MPRLSSSSKHWIPALRNVPKKYVFEPHTAPAAVLKAAGVKIGTDYPLPLVDHSTVAKANMERMANAYKSQDALREKIGSVPTTSGVYDVGAAGEIESDDEDGAAPPGKRARLDRN